MKKINKGFTLIELLVVIAIIGILSSVVLSSLSTARIKGVVSATKAEMDNFKKAAALFYDDNNASYLSLLANDPTILSQVATSTSGLSVQNLLWSIEQKSADKFIYGAVNVAGDAYALYARLPGITDPASVLAADIWCVDSTGKSGNPTVDATAGAGGQFDDTPASVCW